MITFLLSITASAYSESLSHQSSLRFRSICVATRKPALNSSNPLFRTPLSQPTHYLSVPPPPVKTIRSTFINHDIHSKISFSFSGILIVSNTSPGLHTCPRFLRIFSCPYFNFPTPLCLTPHTPSRSQNTTVLQLPYSQLPSV